MTKTRSVAATANDNSTPGSRIEDGTITQEKLSSSITLPLADGSVTTDKLEADNNGTGFIARNPGLDRLSQSVV